MEPLLEIIMTTLTKDMEITVLERQRVMAI
jgi:hypothetical protein